jgi:hypothetical protein
MVERLANNVKLMQSLVERDAAIMDERGHSLSRTQRRSLRRICNGRAIPLVADGRQFLTYRDAKAYLEALAPEDLEAVYAEMQKSAK